MNILQAEPGKEYKIAMLCDDVMMTDRGLIPGETIVLNKIQGGLVWFDLPETGTSLFLREENAKCIRI